MDFLEHLSQETAGLGQKIVGFGQRAGDLDKNRGTWTKIKGPEKNMPVLVGPGPKLRLGKRLGRGPQDTLGWLCPREPPAPGRGVPRFGRGQPKYRACI